VIRLALRVRRAQAELVLAELLELAPAGVEEVDRGDVVEYAVYGAPGELPELPALEAAAGGALVEVATTEVADDWPERWREFHRPVLVGDRLYLRPPWDPPRSGALDIAIDPGAAFGTGAHATTRLCLELLLELAEGEGAPAGGGGAVAEGRGLGPLADLGCGSGVLAIAAAKLGWSPVVAVDHEAAAVEATLANAAANRVRLDVRRVDLRREASPVAATTVANLAGPLLRELAPRLPDPLPRALVVSGVLRAEADAVVNALAARGLAERDRRAEGEWVALLLAAGRSLPQV
jgi:ribosomal protein L11 methyltransferase